MDLVSGYSGSREISLAAERGEVQGLCVSYDTIIRSPAYRSGVLQVLFQTGLAKDPRMTDTPLVLDAAPSAEARQAAQLFLSRASVGRPFAAPPGTPVDRVAALRAGFDAVMKNSEFITESEKNDLHVSPISPDEITTVVAEAYKAPPAIIDLVRKGLGRAGN
jgi:tripartite-type tricarboxylate transporter receptor subunit TctC